MAMNNTFCPLAWTTLGMNPHGRVRACGRSKPNIKNPSLKNMSVEQAWNHNYYKKLRLDMLSGKQNSNCEVCYTMEQAGGTSKRQEILERVRFTEAEARRLTKSDGSINIAPRHIDVRVGNICNLKCIHCWTGNSSKWYEDKLLLDKYTNTANIKMNNRWISDKGDIWAYIKSHVQGIQYLSFLGGEPFASRPKIRFLDWLIENNHTHLFLSYVTNGVLITEDIIKKLEKIKQVELSVSMDALKERAEFMRYPFSWDKLESILCLLNEADFKVYFNWSAYNTNVFTLLETYQYCLQKFPNITFRLCCFVTSPAHMSVQNLPCDFKEKVTNKLKHLKIPHLKYYLQYMNEKSTWNEYNQTLYNYLEDLDQARKTNWRKVLPEIAGLWKQ